MLCYYITVNKNLRNVLKFFAWLEKHLEVNMHFSQRCYVSMGHRSLQQQVSTLKYVL